MDWRNLLSDSFVRPRAAARSVLALRLAPALLLQAAIAVTAAGIVFGYLAVRLGGAEIDQVSTAILAYPLLGAAIQFGAILVVAFLTARIGSLFGGTGSFESALALVVWLNVVMLLIQIVQILLMLLAPPLTAFVAIFAVIWALWAFANFVTELHGFQNPLFVLGGVILSMIVLFFGLAMILTILGLGQQEPL